MPLKCETSGKRLAPSSFPENAIQCPEYESNGKEDRHAFNISCWFN